MTQSRRDNYLQPGNDASRSIKTSTRDPSMLSEFRSWSFTQSALRIRPNHFEISEKTDLQKEETQLQGEEKTSTELAHTHNKELTNNLRIITAILEYLEKSKMISSAIFLSFPYGLIGT